MPMRCSPPNLPPWSACAPIPRNWATRCCGRGKRRAPRALLLLHEEDELVLQRLGGQQRIPGLPGECREVLDRTRVGRDDLEDLARRHVGERLRGAQYRSLTVETT